MRYAIPTPVKAVIFDTDWLYQSVHNLLLRVIEFLSNFLLPFFVIANLYINPSPFLKVCTELAFLFLTNVPEGVQTAYTKIVISSTRILVVEYEVITFIPGA